MIALNIQKELANVNNIAIIQNGYEYSIITEWSRLPIESFSNLFDAIDFCRGFKELPIHRESKAYVNGYMFKSFIKTDISFGHNYYKVNNITANIMHTIV